VLMRHLSGYRLHMLRDSVIGIRETSRESSLIELYSAGNSALRLSCEWLVPNQLRVILVDQETNRTLKNTFFKEAIAYNAHTFRVIILSEFVINFPGSLSS
jgi:hypothetical protein